MPGIFAAQKRNLFTIYQVELVGRDKLMGGVPTDPKIVEGWLKTKAGITKEVDFQAMFDRTMEELGLSLDDDNEVAQTARAISTAKDVDKADAIAKVIAQQKRTNGFKRDQYGIYFESRAIKAALKESVNTLWAGERWLKRTGYQGKGPKAVVAERVFVRPDKIRFIGKTQPDGLELFVGHPTGTTGSTNSNLAYYQYVQNWKIHFEVMVTHDVVKPEQWADVWNHIEENGLGALRSQGHGKNDIMAFARDGDAAEVDLEWCGLRRLTPDGELTPFLPDDLLREIEEAEKFERELATV